MRIHKTPAGRLAAGMGLVLCFATLGPTMDQDLTVAPAPTVVDVDVEDTGLVPSADTGLDSSAASVWPASDVLRTACSIFTCASLYVSQDIDMQGTAFALSGSESGMPSNAANGGFSGVAAGHGAPGSAAGSMPGTTLHLPGGGAMPHYQPADRGQQDIAPILAVLDDGRPLEPAVTEPAPVTVDPGWNDPAPTALLPDPDTPAAGGPIGSPTLLAAAPVDSGGAPVNAGSHPFAKPSGRTSPSGIPSVLPLTGPVTMAGGPDRGPVPMGNDEVHPVPPAAPADHPIDLLDTGRGRDGGALPAMDNDPFDHLFDGPDEAIEGIAGGAPSPAEKKTYLFIDPADDASAFTPTALAAADAPEPSMLALLALAALGLALTRGALHRAGSRAS